MNTSVTLPYGARSATVAVPQANLMGVFAPQALRGARDEDELIREAVRSPIGTPRLRELMRPDMRVVIVADDKTRPTPVSKVLPAVLEELRSAGVRDKQISIVFALGTHTPMTADEMSQRAGPSAAGLKMFNSEFKDPAGLADCGMAPDGVRVLVDKRVAEADFRIAVGSILPHPECGWGGGAKIVYPGVASEETVTAFHMSYAQVDWNSYGSDRAPVRLNMEKWVAAVGLEFIVNTVMTADDRLYRAVAGHYVAAHRKGIEFGREIYSVELPERADIVLITSFRADEDFWLASKAIFAGELVIKDGGTLILVTPCPDGVGPHPEYAEYCGCDDWAGLVREAVAGRTKNPIAVSAAAAIAKMRKRFDIWIASDGLTRAEVERMRCRHFDSAQQALDAALKKHGASARVAVLPYGISTLPFVRGSR